MITFKYEVFATAEGKKELYSYCAIIWNYANGSVSFVSLKCL